MENRKHPRLPAGYGTIRFLGAGRRNPYAVHPAGKTPDGKRAKALCYVQDWYTGMAVLSAWHAGRYEPGLEIKLSTELSGAQGERADAYCAYLLSCFRAYAHGEPTLSFSLKDAYDQFYRVKYGDGAAKKLSASAKDHADWAFQKLKPLWDRALDSIGTDELQRLINGIGLRRSAVGQTVTLVKQVYRFARSRELCSRDPAQYVTMPDVPEDRHHQDFSDEELEILWAHREDPLVRDVLIMCYSGFRYSAYETLETNLAEGYFRGGIKTKAGKNRVVPIHSAIRPLVEEAAGEYHCGLSQYAYVRRMTEKMEEIGIDGNGRHHTPHSCRHTFSRLCESYGVREADRKRLLGHSFGSDITNRVYAHRSLEELRREIEKIQVG